MKINSTNKTYWNIVKGISILCIVIGHTGIPLIYYVYLFHLAIFFFVSGYLYKEEKYGDHPDLNFLTRFKSNWIKYVIFSILLILFHNIFLKLGMIINTQKYSFLDIVTQIINSTIFQCGEVLAGALWFVPLLIFTTSIFGLLIFFGRKISMIFNKSYLKNIIIISGGVLNLILGLYLNLREVNLLYHLQTAFLVIPIYILAYYVRKIKDLNIYLKWYLFLPSIYFLYLCVNKFKWNIELSINQIPGLKFYLISFVGIYFCLYLAKIILKSKYLKKNFTMIGSYSFEIMALHFLSFKLVDIVYAHLIGETNPLIYGTFPCAFSNIWSIYIIVGTILPCLIVIGFKKLKTIFLLKLG